MPLENTDTIAGPFTPNGVTTDFPFEFKAASAAEVQVIDEDGDEVSPALYSVTLTATEGGTVTFSVAPANGGPDLYIISNPLMTQGADFGNSGPSFNPAALTRALDRAAIRDLYLKGLIDKVVPADSRIPGSGAGKFIALDGSGNPVFSEGTGADAGLREDLADDGGAALSGHRRSDAGAVKRSIASVLNERPIMLEDFGGVPGEECGPAWDAMCDVIGGASGRGLVRLNLGRYKFATTPVLPVSIYQLIIEGEGMGRSVFEIQDEDAHGIQLPTPVGTSHSLILRDMEFFNDAGNGGTGRGFSGPVASEYYSLILERVRIQEFGGGGVVTGSGAFTVAMDSVDIDNCNGNGIDGGNNTWTLRNCYIHNLIGSGCGYRIRGGDVEMIGCNGLDSGGIWGIFGSEIDDGDAADNFCFATLDACNVEAFSSIGVSLRGGMLDIGHNTRFTSAAGSTSKAILTRAQNGKGRLGNVSSFVLGGGGATWADGRAVHSKDGQTPFSEVGGGPGSDTQLTYYDENASATGTISVDRQHDLGSRRHARAFYDLHVAGRMSSATAYEVNGNQVVGARGAALPADATDLATALTLVNAIKARMKTTGGHGLVAD